jgi:hypothetical protein
VHSYALVLDFSRIALHHIQYHYGFTALEKGETDGLLSIGSMMTD